VAFVLQLHAGVLTDRAQIVFSKVRLEDVLGSIGQNAYSAATTPTLGYSYMRLSEA
jgi:hypothetical protein